MNLKYKRKNKISTLYGILIPVLFIAVTGLAWTGIRTFSSASYSRDPSSGNALPQKVSQGDSVLNKILVDADNFFKEKKYDLSLAEYEKALKIRPNDNSIQDKIRIVKAAKSELARTEEQYSKTIKSADDYFNEKDYLNAKASYQVAIDIRPNDEYAKARIKETMELLRSQKAKNILYDVAVANAEKLFEAKEYDKAKEEFENASKILPGEKYPRERINAIINIQVNQKTNDEMYSRAITEADKFYNDKIYSSALQEYQTASTYKPDESYPKERIKALTGILAELKVKDEKYRKSIETADKLFDQTAYSDARTEYQNASTLKPDESYPKEKIKTIEGLLSSKKRADDDYDRFIGAADSLYISKKYIQAKSNYQQALKIKPGESYPKEMISKTEEFMSSQLADEKAKEEAYQAAIASADKLFDQKSYDPARAEYQNALNIKPDEKYPKDRIAALDAIAAASLEKIAGELAAQKAKDDQYNRVISNADKLFSEKSYPFAKSEYNKAIQLKPDESYPKEKISEIEKILSDVAASKALNEQFNASLAKADKLFSEKSWDAAITEYRNASGMKPDEKYPKDRITLIEKTLSDIAKQKASEENYRSLIAHADSLLLQKAYEPAKTGYSTALSIKPKDPYPKNRIAEIDKALAEIASIKSKDEQYTASISSGDKLLGEKSYPQARSEYVSASKLKPEESYPKTKIAQVDSLLAVVAQLKALDDKYLAGIAKADKFFTAKSWDAARAEYINSGSLKPEETYPKEKVAEIDKILAGIAEDKARDENYQKTLANADKLLGDKSYNEARAEYSNALKIKAGEKYPQDKISEIDNILAGIAAAKALDDQYTTVISQADKLLGDKSYDLSKAEYQKALGLKPSEAYPKSKISEIDKILDNIQQQKDLDDRYSGLITEGDKLFGEKSWLTAKDKYSAAIAMKPAEQYPKGKLSEIDKILADLKALDDHYLATIANADKLLASKSYDKAKEEYTNAGKLKPDEKYPKDKIAEIDGALAEIARQKALDDQYQGIISKADQLLAAKNYLDARTEYTNAQNLKPSEEYPKTKLAVIEKIFADQIALDDQYNSILAKADKLFSDKSYPEAKTEYLNAGKLKPGESLPKDKITEVDKILAELERQKAIQAQYKASVDKADRYLNDKLYQQAKAEYANAGTIKPDEQYPKDKIAGIESILAELKARDDAYNASVTKADQLFVQKSWEDARTEYQNAGSIKPEEKYPKDKMAEINKILTELKGKRQTFDDLVLKGNTLFGQNDLYKAKESYQQALAIFPDEDYPKTRISRINNMVDSIYRANKGFYDKAVAEGDRSFNSLIFDKAIDSYTEASSYLPMENYPREMIAKIKKIISENAIVDVLKAPTKVTNGEEQKFSFPAVNIASRKNNYFYIKIRNLSDKPFNILVRYGKDKQINGGAVIRNLSGDGKAYDRLISVRDQDPWYREDNNWIGLVPQGGDVEVTFIQISRAQ